MVWNCHNQTNSAVELLLSQVVSTEVESPLRGVIAQWGNHKWNLTHTVTMFSILDNCLFNLLLLYYFMCWISGDEFLDSISGNSDSVVVTDFLWVKNTSSVTSGIIYPFLSWFCEIVSFYFPYFYDFHYYHFKS